MINQAHLSYLSLLEINIGKTDFRISKLLNLFAIQLINSLALSRKEFSEFSFAERTRVRAKCPTRFNENLWSIELNYRQPKMDSMAQFNENLLSI